MRKQKILVSACLLGNKIRYNGTDKPMHEPIWTRWEQEGRLVAICPEVSGGLPVPRPAAEIIGSGGGSVLEGEATVITKSATDVTQAFLTGAQASLALAKQHDIKIAILTDGSPSCGSTAIHDGGFSGGMHRGEGVSTALLRKHGISVFGHGEIAQAKAFLDKIDQE